MTFRYGPSIISIKKVENSCKTFSILYNFFVDLPVLIYFICFDVGGFYILIDLIEDFYWTKDEKTIVYANHHVKGLANFSYFNYSHSFKNFPWHKHTNIMEMHCVVNGERYTQIEENGAINKYVTKGNEIMIIYPNEVHNNGEEHQTPCEFYAFQIDLSDPDHMLGLAPEYSRFLYEILINMKYRQYRFGNSHLRWLRSAFNLFSDFSTESTYIGVQFLTCFLFNLRFMEPICDSKPQTVEPTIQKVLDYILNNITEKLTLEYLSEIAGYSLSRFKIKFKENIGTSPAEFITMQKIEYAKAVLLQKPESITNLALSLGFSSSNYFSYVFRKYTGRTPSEYRKLNLKLIDEYISS